VYKNVVPPELCSRILEGLYDFCTPCRVFMHTVLSVLSFSEIQTSKENNSFFLLPQMEKYDALLALYLLKQPIAESFRVFNNPTKILQWNLLQSMNSKNSFCAL
jgi:hypothetical protein